MKAGMLNDTLDTPGVTLPLTSCTADMSRTAFHTWLRTKKTITRSLTRGFKTSFETILVRKISFDGPVSPEAGMDWNSFQL